MDKRCVIEEEESIARLKRMRVCISIAIERILLDAQNDACNVSSKAIGETLENLRNASFPLAQAIYEMEKKK
jgi:hypothetical protein